jgi:hypothetical protein
VSFAHGLFSVSWWEVQSLPWLIEIIQLYPHQLILILEYPFC